MRQSSWLEACSRVVWKLAFQLISFWHVLISPYYLFCFCFCSHTRTHTVWSHTHKNKRTPYNHLSTCHNQRKLIKKHSCVIHLASLFPQKSFQFIYSTSIELSELRDCTTHALSQQKAMWSLGSEAEEDSLSSSSSCLHLFFLFNSSIFSSLLYHFLFSISSYAPQFWLSVFRCLHKNACLYLNSSLTSWSPTNRIKQKLCCEKVFVPFLCL